MIDIIYNEILCFRNQKQNIFNCFDDVAGNECIILDISRIIELFINLISSDKPERITLEIKKHSVKFIESIFYDQRIAGTHDIINRKKGKFTRSKFLIESLLQFFTHLSVFIKRLDKIIIFLVVREFDYIYRFDALFLHTVDSIKSNSSAGINYTVAFVALAENRYGNTLSDYS